MTEAQPSDAMKRLMVFIVGIAILGLILALVFYFAVDLQAMQATALHIPVNS